jgi:hypothetical protein
MPPRVAPAKYLPLVRYLEALTVDEVQLALPEIEAILGASLSVWAHQPIFWSNNARGVFRQRPWLQAGWRVARTELRSVPPAVTFVRQPSDSST